MMPSFKALMEKATSQTRLGDLAGATATIREALGVSGDAAARGEAPADQARNQARRDDARVIEQVFREIEPSADGGRTDLRDEVVVRGTFGTAAQVRDYRLFIPARAHGERLPMIMMLHGCTQDADDFARGTAMDTLARQRRFMVLYPQQSRRANPQRCWNWFKRDSQQRDRGEPALLADLARSILATQDGRDDALFVAGLSAGGAMAAILASRYPDLVSAVAIHSGLPVGVATDMRGALDLMRAGPQMSAPGSAPPAPPLPRAIVLHGDSDKVVHPENGAALVRACLQQLSRPAGPVIDNGVTNGLGWKRSRYFAPDGRVQAEHWLVHGGGHAWSGGRAEGSHTDSRGPDASALIARFFLESAPPDPLPRAD